MMNNAKIIARKFSRITIYFYILLGFIVITSYTVFNDATKDQELLKVLMLSIDKGHFQPRKINDEFSKDVYKLYLKRLDVSKKFLVQPDIDKLKKYETLIDDEVAKGDYEFYNLAVQTINTRIKEAEGYYKEILDKPFDFTKEETVELDYDKLPFAKNTAELKDSWRKYLKYQVLTRLADAMETQEKAKEKSDTVTIKSFEQLEEDARKKVLKSHDEWFKRLSKVTSNERLSEYLNTVTTTFDPHTNYLAPKAKEQFDIGMTGRFEGIGATLQEKDGYIKVTAIVPGSASWKQGQLKIGDMILKVAQGEQEPVDVVDMRLDDAVQLIRGKKGTEVRLTVKKLDGTIVVIPIIRDVVIIEETYAKSAVIKRDKNIGYIYLPGFYADFNNVGARSCSEDIRKEIMKLKEENISGLILDLRWNTGGSLQDVITMMGLFIEKGPVVQVKSKDAPAIHYDDNDSEVQYKGPLVVLVNSSSASASEILAAAVQDYKRGVVMGGNSTFGKGTVQRIFNLDEWLTQEGEGLKPLGSVKLTTQKFYRVNGGATQLKGVIPDIILPDNYTHIETGEKEEDYPLQWDEISPAQYTTWNSTINWSKVKENSRTRVRNNATFTLINENAERLKKQSDKKNYVLNLKKYRDEQKQLKEESKKYENIMKEISDWTVYSLPSDVKEKSDTVNVAKRSEWHKNIKKDVYIYEATSVIKDMQ